MCLSLQWHFVIDSGSGSSYDIIHWPQEQPVSAVGNRVCLSWALRSELVILINFWKKTFTIYDTKVHLHTSKSHKTLFFLRNLSLDVEVTRSRWKVNCKGLWINKTKRTTFLQTSLSQSVAWFNYHGEHDNQSRRRKFHHCWCLLWSSYHGGVLMTLTETV